MKVLRIDDDLYDKFILNEKNNLLLFYQNIGVMMRFSSDDLSENFERTSIQNSVPVTANLDYTILFNELLNQGIDYRDNGVIEAPSGSELGLKDEDLLMFIFLSCGFTKELHELTDKGVKFIFGVTVGYLIKGSPELLNQLIDAKVDLNVLLYGCFEGKLLNNADDILRVLSIINDDQVRHQFAIDMQLAPIFKNIEMKTLLVYAEKINQLMQSCYLSYPHALAVVENNALTWLTEGRQVCKQREENLNAEHPLPILPLDVYKEISKHVLDQNFMETQLIIKQLQNHQTPSKVGMFRDPDETITCRDVSENGVEPQLITCNQL